MKPLAVDLYCGLGGWSEGLIAAGWYVIGFDREDMRQMLGEPPLDDHALAIQDVLTLHGRQFKDAQLIVGSSPCQEFSYRAMPWKRAKALGPPILGLSLFEAQFRIQREASEAAGRYIPLVVENVRGAQPWVGRAKTHFGSYYLWGDVPALMPMVQPRSKRDRPKLNKGGHPIILPQVVDRRDDDSRKLPGFRFDGSGRSFQSEAAKTSGAPHQRDGEPHTRHLTNLKHGGDCFDDHTWAARIGGQRSPARKAASARIAKIPFALAEWIGRCWLPLNA